MGCRYRYGIIGLLLLSLPFTTQAQKDIFRQMDSMSRLPTAILKRENKDSISRNSTIKRQGSHFPFTGNYWRMILNNRSLRLFMQNHSLWYRTAAVVAATGGVLLLDVPISKNAVEWRKQSPALVNTSKFVTHFGGVYSMYAALALGAYGWVFKNEKIRTTTTTCASQAYITSFVIFEAVKFVIGPATALLLLTGNKFQ